MNEEATYKINVLFGHVEIETQQIPDGAGRWLFQGRSKHFDQEGCLVKVTPWETTMVVSWPKPVSKKWWQLW